MPNKTVLFHTSKNGDVSVYIQRTSHKELHMQGVKLLTSCNTTEGHTTSTKGQGTELNTCIKQLNGIECMCMCREQV